MQGQRAPVGQGVRNRRGRRAARAAPRPDDGPTRPPPRTLLPVRPARRGCGRGPAVVQGRKSVRRCHRPSGGPLRGRGEPRQVGRPKSIPVREWIRESHGRCLLPATTRRDIGGDRAGEQGRRQCGFSRETPLVRRDSGLGTTLRILGPAARQVESPVNEGMSGWGSVGQIHRELGNMRSRRETRSWGRALNASLRSPAVV